jgi:hypothetical protein
MDDGCTGPLRPLAALAMKVPGERRVLHAAVHSRFLKRLPRRRLRVRQSRFGFSLGESPCAAGGTNQQEFNTCLVHSIANGSYLLAITGLG